MQVLTEERIREAEKSLAAFLGLQNLRGKTFLDIGSGSGLFSLAARRLGAEVCSFDFDHSVSCTRELKRRYFPDDQQWQIRQGSILNDPMSNPSGNLIFVIPGGVLHHTGALYQALYNAQLPLKDKGILYVAIYNDQGFVSCLWRLIEKWYCSGVFMKIIFILLFFTMFFLAGLIMDLLSLRNPGRRFTEHQKHHRGMSLIHDWLDWLGGYPYEPATIETINSFYENLSLQLIRCKKPKISFGNNEFLFF